MIHYDTDKLLSILFRWHGSALNGPAPMRALLMALVAAVVAVVNEYHPFVVATRDSTAFVDTLTVFNTFIGLTISFRLNSAFQQWRSGVVATSALSEVARGIVSSGCAYVSSAAPEAPEPSSKHSSLTSESSNVSTTSDEEDTEAKSQGITKDVLEKCTFFTELRRLVFLYIAIVFHDCRDRDGIDKMKDSAVLTGSEYDELYACGSERSKKPIHKESFESVVQQTPHKLRATVVELWLKRLVDVAARRGHMSPVNANNLQLKIAQLPTLYTTVFNIANVPIPFNYMQYLQLLIVAYMALYTVVIVPRSQLYTPLWVFFWGMFLFTADQVAMEIEKPFGLDANDIDLEARLLQIEEELTVLVRSQYYFVSGGKTLPATYTERGHSTPTWSKNTHATAPHSAPWSHTKKPTKQQRALSMETKPAAPSEKSPFSPHHGHADDDYHHQPHSPLAAQDSLPEINEFTGLIAPGSAYSGFSGYGSQHSKSSGVV